MKNKKHGHVHHSRSTRDILDSHMVLETAGLKPGDIFLDAGCGDGFISITASDLVGTKGKVYAMDAYPDSISKLKKEVHKKDIKNLEAILVDLTEEIPLDDNSIDLCVMANVLHGFVVNDEVEEVMREIHRIIKPGGVFALVEFKKVEAEHGPPFHIRVSPQEVEDLAHAYGFETVETVEVGLHHYLVKAIRK